MLQLQTQTDTNRDSGARAFIKNKMSLLLISLLSCLYLIYLPLYYLIPPSHRHTDAHRHRSPGEVISVSPTQSTEKHRKLQQQESELTSSREKFIVLKKREQKRDDRSTEVREGGGKLLLKRDVGIDFIE